MKYDESFLPRINLFKKGTALSSAQDMFSAFESRMMGTTKSVLDPSNQNLSPFKRLWMLWHIKLEHLSFERVLKLALGGYLDQQAMKLQREVVGKPPVCASCAFGRQVRKPDGTTITSKNPETQGSLKEGMLDPGQQIFCDQLESSVRGHLFHTAGKEPDKDKFCDSTLFCDAASGYMHVEHQVTLNASDSIAAKDSFERSLLHMGVTVDSYHTDNGFFKSRAFVDEIVDNVQSIRYSGVGAKWQSGVADSPLMYETPFLAWQLRVLSRPSPL